MKIVIVEDAGYCFGVRNAVNLAFKAADEYGDVYMLGHIVHNESVIKDLEDAGAKVVEVLDDIPKECPVLFRAHGTTDSLWRKAQQKEMNIIDATCPLVREIHDEVKKLEANDRHVIIIGDHGHDEVSGIASQVKDSIVVATPEEAQQLPKMKRAGVVCQSTQTIENVQVIIDVLITKVFDLQVVNTICFPTKRNQEQIKQLASKSDLMIIIGSFISANSKRLAQLSREINPKTYQVNSAKDIDPAWFNGIEKVGISAGSSTPDYLIEEVKFKIEEISKSIAEV